MLFCEVDKMQNCAYCTIIWGVNLFIKSKKVISERIKCNIFLRGKTGCGKLKTLEKMDAELENIGLRRIVN